MKYILILFVMLAGACRVAGGEAAPAGRPALDPVASEIYQAAGIERGLCVQLGGDSKLAGALHGQGRFLVVQFLHDAAAVNAARERIRALGLYGQVSAERSAAGLLPLAENLANLVVIDDPAGAAKAGFQAAEVLRVLVPNGVALIRSGSGADELGRELKKAGGSDAVASNSWVRVVKPRSADYDDWTHPGYGPDNSRVSRDKALGPPSRLRWLTGPFFPTSGESSHYSLILSAGGRNYYMLNWSQGMLPVFSAAAVVTDPASGMPQAAGAPYWIVVRDAYNGLPLWRRAYDGTTATMVADRRRLYTMLAGTAVAIDGESGRVIARYGKVNDTRNACFAFKDGMLAIADMKAIRVVDTATGKDAWTAPIAPKSVFVIEGALVVVLDNDGHSIFGRELATGREVWKFDNAEWLKGWRASFMSRDGRLIIASNMGKDKRLVTVLSAKDGKQLWNHEYALSPDNSRRTILPAGGLIWIQKYFAKPNDQEWQGFEPETGKIERTLTTYRTGAAGCHPDVACDGYIMLNRPADFLSLNDGKLTAFRSSRPACGYGATLANGLFYAAPNNCVCVKGNLHGFVAIGPADSAVPVTRAGTETRLETGAASGAAAGGAEQVASEWPTLRRDPARSSSADGAKLSSKLKVLWKSPVIEAGPAVPSLLSDEAALNWTGGDPVTAPTVAGGRVFAGLPDRHTVIALDAATGRTLWSAVIGGRMDAPPTVSGELCFVGGRDGWVYALRVSDGVLAWRFRAAPDERWIVAFGQLESTWPVVGGVLVRNGLAYAVVGRSSEIDGGIRICCLEAGTGKLVWEACRPGNDPAFAGLADLLVADGQAVSCGGSTHCRLDLKTGKLLGRTSLDAVRAGTTNGEYFDSIGSASALLDRSWHYARSLKVENRFQTQWKDGMKGQIVVFDKSRTVGVKRGQLPGKPISIKVVAQNRSSKPNDKPAPLWGTDLRSGQLAEALAIAGDYVLVGTASDNRREGSLQVLGMKDGVKLEEYPLPGSVASEGVAVAGDNVYVSSWPGEVLCFGPAPAAKE